MQIFKSSYVVVLLLFCVSLVSCTPKNAESSSNEENSSQNTETATTENTEGSYTYSYKLGAEPKVEGKEETLSVYLIKTGIGKKGQETYHTDISFKIIYLPNKISLSFGVMDKSVVETMNGHYPFAKSEGFSSGEEQNLMSVMIVDAEGKYPPLASKEASTSEINFDGKNLKISIKGTVAQMKDSEVTMPFEFELDAKNVKLKKTGF